jgi:integrase
LRAAKTTWWKALLVTAYTTAARLGEIMNPTWADVDFEQNRIRIVPKDVSESLAAWEPKDHEGRLLPVPAQVTQLIADLQTEAAEACPYVFVPAWRWQHIQQARRLAKWKDERDLVNNLNRRLATLRKGAGVAKFTFHDLRRSCITNWARHLPAHVVQKLAGHSDLKTTQRYYLSVQADDLEKARQVQSGILGGQATDPKLTHLAQNPADDAAKAKRSGT